MPASKHAYKFAYSKSISASHKKGINRKYSHRKRDKILMCGIYIPKKKKKSEWQAASGVVV